MSRVDVIVPCYKYGHYLRGCVDSVLSQAGIDVRVLILDDTSPDDTPEVGQRLAADDPRVEYRRHAVNLGHIATYNEGLDWATSDYVLLLSADDLLIPGALARAAAVMDAHPEVAFTYGMQVIVRSDGPLPAVPAVDDPRPWRIQSGPEFIEEVCRLSSNPVPTPTAVVRTSVHRIVGDYRPELPHSGDMEMWLRLAAHGSVGIVHAYQAYYRRHGENMILDYRWTKDIEQRRDAFASVFREHGDRIPDAGRLHGLARANLANAALRGAHSAFEAGEWDIGRTLMSQAAELWPEARSGPQWSRLRWKQRLRPLWPVMRRMVGGLQTK